MEGLQEENAGTGSEQLKTRHLHNVEGWIREAVKQGDAKFLSDLHATALVSRDDWDTIASLTVKAQLEVDQKVRTNGEGS